MSDQKRELPNMTASQVDAATRSKPFPIHGIVADMVNQSIQFMLDLGLISEAEAALKRKQLD